MTYLKLAISITKYRIIVNVSHTYLNLFYICLICLFNRRNRYLGLNHGIYGIKFDVNKMFINIYLTNHKKLSFKY